jgi:hypothetical protein
MSTTTDIDVARLEDILRRLTIYISLFYLICGNLGNLFKVFFFLQRPLKSCPCTVYILTATFSDFITLNNIPMLKLLYNLFPSSKWINISFGWSLSSNTTMVHSFRPSQMAINMCKTRSYLHMWSTDISFQLLLFASINRFCFSWRKASRMKNQRFINFFCNLSNTYKISLFICVFWSLVSLHHIFNFTVISNTCVPRHAVLWTVWMSAVHCFQSVLMILFGVLTLILRRKATVISRRHCRYCHERTPIFVRICQQCLDGRKEHYHVEAQLTSMIIAEIVLALLTSLPYAIYVVYRLMTAANQRSAIQKAQENLIELFMRMTMYFESSCGFYVYLFTLKTLKRRFVMILLSKLRGY